MDGDPNPSTAPIGERVHEELAELVARERVIRRADHPGVARRCDWAIARGELVALLRGVYVAASAAQDVAVRALAVCLADPDAVVVGLAAQALHLQKPFSGPIEVVSWRLHDRGWLHVRRRRLPPELIVRLGAVNLASRALAAIDLAPSTEGASIDDALRMGVPLHDLHFAHVMLGPRRGSVATRRLLEESRDEPWSPAERRAHVLLRRAGVGGWTANRPVRDSFGSIVGFLDVGFDSVTTAIEVDGDRWHLSAEHVLRDRARDQRLSELGWTVVRFRASQVQHEPEAFVESVLKLLRVRGSWCQRTGKWVRGASRAPRRGAAAPASSSSRWTR